MFLWKEYTIDKMLDYFENYEKKLGEYQ